ncbi:MAG: hypothetical protein AAF183_06370 [Pseudomonadota bacterium]
MLRTLISAAEALGLLVVLVLALSYSVPLVIWVSLGLILISAFVLITGRKLPRIQSRGKALVVGSIAGVCLTASATIYQDQREENLALLRASDPDAYLAELQRIDDARWIAELEQLRPERHAEEMERRAQLAEAERQRACTDRKLGEAYVMIQANVRSQLRAPSTASFPVRYGQGTRHTGNCIYHVVGHVDAQNGFGAVLRVAFQGRIEYFPDAGSWRTLELSVDG